MPIVWDIPVKNLCYKHLNLQHHSVHLIRLLIVDNIPGWETDPEMNRWRGHLQALKAIHDATATELDNRFPDYHHDSSFPDAHDSPDYPPSWQPVSVQVAALIDSGCDCELYNLIR